MTVELFLTLLVFCSTLTSLVTEAIKKLVDDEFPSNMLVLFVALIVGCSVVGVYYVTYGVEFNTINIMYLIFMGIANWLGAMVGYDKIKQLIEQIKKY